MGILVFDNLDCIIIQFEAGQLVGVVIGVYVDF